MKKLAVLALLLSLAACAPSQSASRAACEDGDQVACYDYVQDRLNQQQSGLMMLQAGAYFLTPPQNRVGIAGF